MNYRYKRERYGLIECRTHYGEKKLVPVSQFKFRPSAYAIILNMGNILLVKSRKTDKYMLPGGGIEIGDKNEVALQREVKEETGIDVSIQAFLQFTEFFFYHDPHHAAYHGLFFYYNCVPLSLDIPKSFRVDDEEAVSPKWYPVAKLNPKDFHNNGQLILNLIETLGA